MSAKSAELPAGIHQTQLDFIDPAGILRASLEVELNVHQEQLPIQVSSRSLSFNRNQLKRSIRLPNLGIENRGFAALASSSLVRVRPEQGSIPANSEILLDLTISETAFQSWGRHQLAIEFSDGLMEILELDLGLLPSAGVCPSSAPVLSFLNPPAAYEWTVGIPQSVQVVVRNPCGAIQQGSALAIHSEKQGVVSLWPTEDGTWTGSWTPQFASRTASIQAIWMDSTSQQSVSRTISGRVRPNQDLAGIESPHP